MSGARRVLLAGDDAEAARAAAERWGLHVVADDPELVLCHGGDGTLLRAEQIHPGVPKLTARIGSRARLCPAHRLETLVEAWSAGRLPAERLGKLELWRAGLRALALNDIVLRNASPANAVRFRVRGAGRDSGEVVGDGLVFATPFGSTGYYRSITRRSFAAGMGVAFNNSTEPVEPIVLEDHERLAVELIRGPAVLLVDNRDDAELLGDGERFEVCASAEQAVVHGLDALRCQECRRADGSRFNPH